MPSPTSSSPTGPAFFSPRDDAEVLIWMGTAYGRTRTPGSAQKYLPPRDADDVSTHVVSHRPGAAALVLLVLGLALLAFNLSHMREPAPADMSSAELPQTKTVSPAAPARESNAPTGTATRAAAETLAHAAAELPFAPATAEVESPPVHGADSAPSAGDAAPAAAPPVADLPKSEDARSTPAPAPLPLAKPEPLRVTEAVSAEATTTAAPDAVTGYAAGNPDIIVGQQRFAKGDITGARRAFEKALKAGYPEGALGLGTTYDPAAIEKAGLKAKADPALAQDWYRRAFELALKTKRGKG